MKRTSKSTKETSKKMKTSAVLAQADDMVFSEEDSNLSLPAQKRRRYTFTAIALVILVALALFKFNYLLIPARVGNEPVFIWQYFSYLHKNYGREGIQRLTTQDLINQAIVKSGVTVKSDDIQKEIDLLDKQASSSGGIQAMLAAQQMTMQDLRDQLRIQLAVKQILKDKIVVTDQEVSDYYKKNKDLFRGMTQADAYAQIRSQLENQKFQTEATAWLADVRKNTPIQITFPGLQ